VFTLLAAFATIVKYVVDFVNPFFTRVYLLVLDQGRRRNDRPSSQGNHRRIALQYFQRGGIVVRVDRTQIGDPSAW